MKMPIRPSLPPPPPYSTGTMFLFYMNILMGDIEDIVKKEKQYLLPRKHDHHRNHVIVAELYYFLTHAVIMQNLIIAVF